MTQIGTTSSVLSCIHTERLSNACGGGALISVRSEGRETQANWCNIWWLWWAPAATQGCPCPYPWVWCRVPPAPPPEGSKGACTQRSPTTTPSTPQRRHTPRNKSNRTGRSDTELSESFGKSPVFVVGSVGVRNRPRGWILPRDGGARTRERTLRPVVIFQKFH